MTDLAALVGAIAFLILVIGVFVVLYYPPKFLKKFKFRGLEGEFTERPSTDEPQAAVPESAGASEEPDEPTNESDPPVTIDPGLKEFTELYQLFTGGKYKEGMDRVDQRSANDTPEKKAVDVAYWALVAHRFGADEAFPDLQKLATDFPSVSRVQLSYARALSDIGSFDDAIRAAEEALRTSESDADFRMSVTAHLADVLPRTGRHKDAVRAVIEESKNPILSPIQKARVYRILAGVYEEMNPANSSAAAALYELAIRLNPGDSDWRFQLAYKYGDRKAQRLALFHYHRLLARDPEHVCGTNNAGVAAQALSLPIRAVEYYRRAEAKDNTLASANIAQKLLAPGFKDEATAVLNAANAKDDVHQNVAITVGRIATEELTESNTFDELDRETKKFVALRIKHAEALIGPSIELEDVVGDYGVLSLESVGGKVVGHFKDGNAEATLSGQLERRTLSFSWQTVRNPSILGVRSGHVLRPRVFLDT